LRTHQIGGGQPNLNQKRQVTELQQSSYLKEEGSRKQTKTEVENEQQYHSRFC